MSKLLCVLLVVLIPVTTFSQWGYDDAPTRRGIGPKVGTMEGLIMEKKVGATPDAKDVTLTFILSDAPSVYFDYYDEQKKALIIDLYDIRIGDSQLDTIMEPPIYNSTVENIEIDLNKDVAGLKPDMRQVVRITLNSELNFPYVIEEEFGVFTLTFRWSRRIQKRLAGSKTAIYWKFPLAVAGVMGLGAGAWVLWFMPNPPVDDPCPICPLKDKRPDHPGK